MSLSAAAPVVTPPAARPTEDASLSYWYAVRVRSRFEFAVRDGLALQAIEQYVPTTRTETRWSDRYTVTTRPLFAGYVFARFDPVAQKNEVLQTRGVVDILSIDSAPAAIPAAQIENLRRVCAAPGTVACCPYVAGDTVTIARGPFAGVSGVVTRVKGAATLTLHVEGLRQAVSVSIDIADLDPPTKEPSKK